ncbi:DNA alkylation repair enzyme [Sphingobacterium multivorum]|uniref:HEAT repeat domain-containing protein n=1 Tax=Sphingobacterium multivorum TaxID=28454 RepID=UPI000E05F470|nr:DNA alkylation repair protein [Sphingobacterium multivorum]QQT46068.1 DNA alkylation repair protein [Sphingobacterium multivorum]SUJ30778.1 DNA alkylation repair enzyme [Sphingobacterium multivorum]
MEKSIENTIETLKDIEHGFKHIIDAGDIILIDMTLDHFDIAKRLLKDESYQVRMLAVHLLGRLAFTVPEALDMLETKVSADSNWRVQEMLAKAFDQYCSDNGYENSLPKINKWLTNPHPNVKRAVIEGLRIWTSRPYFKEHPEVAINLISQHRADDSEYLRKSVGNSLRDIKKRFPEVVEAEISAWEIANKNVAYTMKLVQK